MQSVTYTIARPDTGAVLPYAVVTVYQQDGTTRASLFDAEGAAIGNPLDADINGAISFAALNGTYILRAVSADGELTLPDLTVQVFDLAALATAIAAGGLGGVIGAKYATKAARDADLAKDDGTIALVYADSEPLNNDLSYKIGSSGSGAWSAPLGLMAGLAANYATSSQTWAEGTEPGGPGTKSAKGWAEEASASEAAAVLAVAPITDKLGATTYLDTQTPVGGLPGGGGTAASTGRIHAAPSTAVAVGGPLRSIAVQISNAGNGTGSLLLLSQSGGTYRVDAVFPVTGLSVGTNTFAAGTAFPTSQRIEAGQFIGFWSASGGGVLDYTLSAGGGSNIVSVTGSVAVGNTFTSSVGNSTLRLTATYGVATNAIEPRLSAITADLTDLKGSFPVTRRAVYARPRSTLGGNTTRGGWSAGITTNTDLTAGRSYKYVRVVPSSIAASASYIRMRHLRRPSGDSQSAVHLAAGDTSVASYNVPVSAIASDGSLTFTLSTPITAATTPYDYFVFEAFDASNNKVSMDFTLQTSATGTVFSRGCYFFGTGSSTMTAANAGVAISIDLLTDAYTATADAGPALGDVVSSATATPSGLTVTVAGVIQRDTDAIPFSGSVTLTGTTTGSVTTPEARTLGQSLASGAPGFAVCPVAGRLANANVSSVVVTRTSDSAVLTLNTDYLLNSEHGSICLPSTGTDVPVTVTYNWARRRYSTIYVDPDTLAVAVVDGTERTRDAQEFLPTIPTKAIALFNVRVVGTTVEIIPVWDAYAGEIRALAEQVQTDRNRNQRRLPRSRAELLRGTVLKIGIYSDSIGAMQNGSPSATTPNGTARDRAASTNGYLVVDGAIGSDLYGALPLYTAVQNGWADDGAGAVHTRFGHVWFAAEELASMYGATIGTNLIINNWGIGGTDLSNTGSNALAPTRMNAMLAGDDDLIIEHFGMNNMTLAANEANLATLVTNILNAGKEVIVCGVPRINAFRYGLTYQNWRDINRIKRRVAERLNVAFCDTAGFYADPYLDALGISSKDTCSANGFNHPAIMEHRRMSRPLVEMLMP